MVQTLEASPLYNRGYERSEHPRGVTLPINRPWKGRPAACSGTLPECSPRATSYPGVHRLGGTIADRHFCYIEGSRGELNTDANIER